jgi:hypothetical protein
MTLTRTLLDPGENLALENSPKVLWRNPAQDFVVHNHRDTVLRAPPKAERPPKFHL